MTASAGSITPGWGLFDTDRCRAVRAIPPIDRFVITTLEEHIGYLADRVRLERFGQALPAVVRPGDVVADIGCGARRARIDVPASRRGEGLWHRPDRRDRDRARDDGARQGLGDRYHCLREHSFRAVLPEQVDLIVCDHVGCFGIDYGIVKTLGDARRRFLKPGGRMVPRRDRPVIWPASNPRKAGSGQRPGSSANVPEEFNWLQRLRRSIRSTCTAFTGKRASRPRPCGLGSIDLLRLTVRTAIAFKVSLRVSRDGMLDGLGGWFECELAENVWMTNSPFAADRIDAAPGVPAVRTARWK